MDYDIVIRNGTVVDGTQFPRFRADVGLKGGVIRKIGRIPSGKATRELDATNCIVAPGFIDLHTHYDAQIFWDPYCTPSGWHGVTTFVIGNCGFGFAPVKPADRDRSLLMMTRTEQIPYESMKVGMPITWETFPEFLEALRRIPKGVNLMTYVPLSPLVIYVMGLEASKTRAATPAEQREMKRLLNQAMDAGACGFSLQRFGPNSPQADYDGTPMPTDVMVDEDILVLADVLRERDEGFIQVTQMPYPSEAVKRKFLETLASRAQRPIFHNSIIAFDDAPAEKAEEELAWVSACNSRGLRIFAQGFTLRSYTYFTLEHWNLYDSSPAWNFAMQGPKEERKKRLADPDVLRRMRQETDDGTLNLFGLGGPVSQLLITNVAGHKDLEKYVGRRVGEVAAQRGQHAIDTIAELSIAGDLDVEFRTGGVNGGTDPNRTTSLVKGTYTLAGVSDGGAHTKFFNGGAFTTDFLSWLVRETGKVTLEFAHYHLSYMPARAAGLTDRGMIREGAAADIIIYELDKLSRDPEWEYVTLRDLPANEWRRVQYSKGYRWTIVNGQVTFDGGKATDARPGKVLSPNTLHVESQRSAVA